MLKADPWAGFAIVTYTGDGVAGRRIAHGLGRAPAFMVVKRLNSAADWRVYHAALGAAKSLILNTTAVVFTTSVWHGAEPDSTHFTVGSTAEVNGDGSAYVAYLFADSDVFRAFSYVGNGSTDGPVVDVGGRPLAVPFLKNTADTQMWVNLDAARDPVNPATRLLHPNGSDAEDASGQVAAYSSGMKIATGAGNLNGAGKLFVGLAVLRQPFKYSQRLLKEENHVQIPGWNIQAESPGQGRIARLCPHVHGPGPRAVGRDRLQRGPARPARALYRIRHVLGKGRGFDLSEIVSGATVDEAARQENEARAVRAERDRLLLASDWTQLADSPLSDSGKAAWAAYRRELREVPEQAGFPDAVAWPVCPES